MTVKDAMDGKEYIIQKVETNDAETDAFLFSLGCFEGETIVVLSRRKGGCTIAVKDGRYSIDNFLAESIFI